MRIALAIFATLASSAALADQCKLDPSHPPQRTQLVVPVCTTLPNGNPFCTPKYIPSNYVNWTCVRPNGSSYQWDRPAGSSPPN